MLNGMSNKLALLFVSGLIAGCGGLNSGGSIGGSGNSSAGSAGNSSAGSGGILGGGSSAGRANDGKVKNDDSSKHATPMNAKEKQQRGAAQLDLADIFNPPNDNADIRVNKYLWEASLETLSFLPIEAADPFSGIVVMGWGRAPGSSTDFRATILIQDPALEAGSLKVAMQKRNGPASAETNRQIEDAILTRARQLRIRAGKRR